MHSHMGGMGGMGGPREPVNTSELYEVLRGFMCASFKNVTLSSGALSVDPRRGQKGDRLRDQEGIPTKSSERAPRQGRRR